MAINIEIVSDVSSIVKDTATLADRYDDVSDALKDVARAGDNAGDDLEKGVKDSIRAARDLDKELDKAGDGAKKLGADGDDAFDKISASARKAGKDVGASQKEGLREAGEGLGDFKEEANSTAKESAASFDGSAESIVGSFQEIAANAFAGFGPAGAAAGLAMAVGLGLAITAAQDVAENANNAKQKSIDMVDAIKDAGGDLSNMDLADKIIGWGREVMEDNWITFWSNEASTKFQETAKDAKTYGVSARDAIRAASGSAEDSQKFLDATADSWHELTKKVEEGQSVSEAGLVTWSEESKAAARQKEALSDLRGQAEENIKTTADAVEIYELEKSALDETTEAAEKAAEAVQEKADASNNAADAALSVVGAENDWIETLKQMNEDIKSNGKNLDSNTQAGRDNKTSLVELADAANGFRDAQISAGGSTASVTELVNGQREAFIKAAEAAGYSGDEAAALADKYGLIPGNVETLVQAQGTEEATAKIEGIPEAKDATVTTTETGAAEAGAKIDAAATDKDATITTTDAGTAGEVQARIDGLKGRDIKIDVQDFRTVEQTQDRINGLKGRDVPITVSISNLGQIQSTLDALTAPRALWVTVNERAGVQAP